MVSTCFFAFSDITSLAKDDAYTHIQLDQTVISQVSQIDSLRATSMIALGKIWILIYLHGFLHLVLYLLGWIFKYEYYSAMKLIISYFIVMVGIDVMCTSFGS